MGGRGTSSGGMGGGFTSANGNGQIEGLFPAELNYGTSKGNSVDAVLGRFQDKYGDADREYGILVDKDGYAMEHNKGGKHSVGFFTDVEGGTFIHNHPSGGNFSKQDLITISQTKAKSIIATSSNQSSKGTYKFEKTNHFDAEGFRKALNKAKWPKNMSYSEGADWWLKKNASKYGYKYTATGIKNAP